MTSVLKRPFSLADIDGDSDIEILDDFTPSTPPSAQKKRQAETQSSAKRGPVLEDVDVIVIDDDVDLSRTASTSSRVVKSKPHSDELPLPTTPLIKRRKYAHTPAAVTPDDDNDEYMPEMKAPHTAPTSRATARANAAPPATPTGTAGRQAALPTSWEAWCNQHALKPTGERLHQQKGMHVMHYSDAMTFFKFKSKEELAPLPYYTFPNSNVPNVAATGSAYRWVDLLFHAFRREVVLKDWEIGLKPPGDPTEQAMFMIGKDLFKTKLERANDKYEKQYGKERFPPAIRVVRRNSGPQLVSYSDKAAAARHRDLKDCECTTTHICEDPKKAKKKGKKPAKSR